MATKASENAGRHPRRACLVSEPRLRTAAVSFLAAWNVALTLRLSSGRYGAPTDPPSPERLPYGSRPWRGDDVAFRGLDRLRDVKAGMERGRFCVPWEVEMDAWWAHAPDWDTSSEDDDGVCFSRASNDDARARFLRRLHDVQWGGNCSRVHTKHMWSSGWGADLSNVADGLLYGLEMGRPFQIAFKKWNQAWNYAALKDGSKPVCPSRDMFCYFLPLSRCKPGRIDMLPYRVDLVVYRKYSQWLTSYISRPQQWLRHRIYKLIKGSMPHVSIPCAALHVRRGDIVLGGKDSRKYFPLSDYLALLPNSTKNVLLFTDDANAIDEAKEFHPSYNWMYLNKKRYRGKEGGWEQHFPSGDPATEVVALLAELRLAKHCDTLVRGVSSFADMLYDEMTSTGRDITQLRVDRGRSIESLDHARSADELSELLQARRKQASVSKG